MQAPDRNSGWQGGGIGSHPGNQIQTPSGSSPYRQEKTVSRTELDRPSRPGAGATSRTRKDRLEIDHGPAGGIAQGCCEDAVRMLCWYALRWKIEVFHKILKIWLQGGRLKIADGGTASQPDLGALHSQLANILDDDDQPIGRKRTCFAGSQRHCMSLLDRLVPDSSEPSARKNAKLSTYLTKIARLGGSLARGHDPPPGNTVMWRGLSRLTDIQLGFELGTRLVGN